MTRSEIMAFNAGIAALAEVCEACAFVLRARLMMAPTRYGYAIAALNGIVEAAGDLQIQHPNLGAPDETETSAQGNDGEGANAC